MKIDGIQKLLYEHNKYASRYEVNFILSHVDTMACFCNLPVTYHSAIAVTDMEFVPIFMMETNAYAHACGISDSGKYAIFQLAYSDGDDSGCAFFIDVENKQVLWKKNISPHWKTIASYHIDDKQMLIYEHHKQIEHELTYTFDGCVIENN